MDFLSKDLQSETAFLINVRTLLREVVQEAPKTRAHLSQFSFELSHNEKLGRYSYELQWNFEVEKVKEYIINTMSN